MLPSILDFYLTMKNIICSTEAVLSKIVCLTHPPSKATIDGQMSNVANPAIRCKSTCIITIF